MATSHVAGSRTPVRSGVTYWPADVGPYLWHEFDAQRVAGDLRQVSSTGHRIVRVLLSWDAFMTSPASVSAGKLRHLERFLEMVSAESLQAVPVLFVQTVGDCVMLPTFAIDVSSPRRGVRVVTDGVVQPGGPRDVYADQLMLDASRHWAEVMVSGFAGHTAIAWWGMGADPASTVRPRRIAQFGEWLSSVTEPFRDAGELCGLTLGTADLVSARGMRPALVLAQVDVAGVELDARVAALDEPGSDGTVVLFLMQLAQRLSDVGALHAHLSVCEQDDAEDTPEDCLRGADAARFGADAVDMLTEHGCSGLFAAQWSRPDQRIASAPPFDHDARVSHRGVVDATARPTQFGQSWMSQLRRERDVQDAAPWPPQLDVEGFYANLPESLRDLYAEWKHEREVDPAMLS